MKESRAVGSCPTHNEQKNLLVKTNQGFIVTFPCCYYQRNSAKRSSLKPNLQVLNEEQPIFVNQKSKQYFQQWSGQVISMLDEVQYSQSPLQYMTNFSLLLNQCRVLYRIPRQQFSRLFRQVLHDQRNILKSNIQFTINLPASKLLTLELFLADLYNMLAEPAVNTLTIVIVKFQMMIDQYAKNLRYYDCLSKLQRLQFNQAFIKRLIEAKDRIIRKFQRQVIYSHLNMEAIIQSKKKKSSFINQLQQVSSFNQNEVDQNQKQLQSSEIIQRRIIIQDQKQNPSKIQSNTKLDNTIGNKNRFQASVKDEEKKSAIQKDKGSQSQQKQMQRLRYQTPKKQVRKQADISTNERTHDNIQLQEEKMRSKQSTVSSKEKEKDSTILGDIYKTITQQSQTSENIQINGNKINKDEKQSSEEQQLYKQKQQKSKTNQLFTFSKQTPLEKHVPHQGTLINDKKLKRLNEMLQNVKAQNYKLKECKNGILKQTQMLRNNIIQLGELIQMLKKKQYQSALVPKIGSQFINAQQNMVNLLYNQYQQLQKRYILRLSELERTKLELKNIKKQSQQHLQKIEKQRVISDGLRTNLELCNKSLLFKDSQIQKLVKLNTKLKQNIDAMHQQSKQKGSKSQNEMKLIKAQYDQRWEALQKQMIEINKINNEYLLIINSKNEIIDQLEKDYNEIKLKLSKDVEKHKQMNKNNQIILINYKNQVAILNKQLQRLKSNKINSKQEIEKLKQEVDYRMKQIGAMELKYEKAFAQVSKKISQKQVLIDGFCEKLEVIRTKIKISQQQKQSGLRQLSNKNEQVMLVKQQNKFIIQSIEILKDKQDENKKRLNQLHSSIKQLGQKNRKTNEQKQMKQIENKQLLEKINIYEQQLQNVREELKFLTKALQQVQQHEEKQIPALKKCDTLINELQDKIDEANEELEDDKISQNKEIQIQKQQEKKGKEQRADLQSQLIFEKRKHQQTKQLVKCILELQKHKQQLIDQIKSKLEKAQTKIQKLQNKVEQKQKQDLQEKEKQSNNSKLLQKKLQQKQKAEKQLAVQIQQLKQSLRRLQQKFQQLQSINDMKVEQLSKKQIQLQLLREQNQKREQKILNMGAQIQQLESAQQQLNLVSQIIGNIQSKISQKQRKQQQINKDEMQVTQSDANKNFYQKQDYQIQLQMQRKKNSQAFQLTKYLVQMERQKQIVIDQLKALINTQQDRIKQLQQQLKSKEVVNKQAVMQRQQNKHHILRLDSKPELSDLVQSNKFDQIRRLDALKIQPKQVDDDNEYRLRYKTQQDQLTRIELERRIYQLQHTVFNLQEQLKNQSSSYDQQLMQELINTESLVKSKQFQIKRLVKVFYQILNQLDQNKRTDYQQKIKALKF